MRALICGIFFLLAAPAFAYVNPGAGITFLGALLGFLAALVFVVVGLVLWPIRRYLRYRKAQQAKKQNEEEEKAASSQQEPPPSP